MGDLSIGFHEGPPAPEAGSYPRARSIDASGTANSALPDWDQTSPVSSQYDSGPACTPQQRGASSEPQRVASAPSLSWRHRLPCRSVEPGARLTYQSERSVPAEGCDRTPAMPDASVSYASTADADPVASVDSRPGRAGSLLKS